MDIIDNRIKGKKITFKESPNHSGIFAVGMPDTIIIHFTAGSSAASSASFMCSPDAKASAHLLVGRDETITQLVPFDTIAWHAGRSSYDGRKGFNNYSIGIEIDNAGRLTRSGDKYVSWFGKAYPADEVVEAIHQNESEPSFWHRYTEWQISAVQEICSALVKEYGIQSILGHEEVAPRRKFDPGPAFPLTIIRERVLVRDRSKDGPEDEPQEHKAGMVITNQLNIRSSPVNGAIVAPPLPKGTVVDILREKNGWYEVDVKTRGWVKKDYIKT